MAPSRVPISRTDSAAPLGVYGASKLAGDEAVRDRLACHIILRTAWVFSAHGVNFVKTILRFVAERQELRVVNDQRGGPTAAADIADALLAIAARIDEGSTEWGTYHFCGAPAVTWCGFACAIVAEAARYRGKTIPVVPIGSVEYPTAARRPANSVLDCAKIAAAFGIAQPDWHRGLAASAAMLLGQEIHD